MQVYVRFLTRTNVFIHKRGCIHTVPGVEGSRKRRDSATRRMWGRVHTQMKEERPVRPENVKEGSSPYPLTAHTTKPTIL